MSLSISYKEWKYSIHKKSECINFEPSESFWGSWIFINPSELLSSSVVSCVTINFITYLHDSWIKINNLQSEYYMERKDNEMAIFLIIIIDDNFINKDMLIDNLREAKEDCIISKYFRWLMNISLKYNNNIIKI